MTIQDGKYIKNDAGYYGGQLLIATPQIQQSIFTKSVIYMCVHNEYGAMGVIINHEVNEVVTQEVLKQLDLADDEDELLEELDIPIHFGGPVEPGRGYILHTPDYQLENTLVTEDGLYLTSDMEALADIITGKGPSKYLLALGYAGWGQGQLENEVQENGWFTAPATHDLVFNESSNSKWLMACRSVGVNPYMLSDAAGHA